MYRAIFESNLPGLLGVEEQARRIAQWQQAGLNAVIVQVDAGTGGCWPSSIMPTDPRINLVDEPLRRFVDDCHEAGLSVVLDFATACFATWANPLVRPDLADGGPPQMYNYWLPEFRDWKSECIAECAAYVDADAIALDYLRSGRNAHDGEDAPATLMTGFIDLVRSKVDASYSLMSMNNAVYVTSPREGVDVVGWLANGLIHAACVFNYSNPYPVRHLDGLDQSRVWALSGNYDMVNGAAASRDGRMVAKDWRHIIRKVEPAGVGLYLANKLTDDQVTRLGHTERMIR